MTGHKLLSFDGTPLHYCRFTPDMPPKGTLIIVHGMGEHGGRYRRLAEHLLPLGVESIALDLRGFGQSGGARAYVPRFEYFLKDLEAIHAFVYRRNNKLPIFLLGHSLGGLIASDYAAGAKRPPLKGLVLSSPAFGIAIPVPTWKHLMALAVSVITPHYSEKDNVSISLLTHDAVIRNEYEKDPLIYHRITTGLYREMTRAIKRSAQIAARLSLPVLVLQAGNDAIVKKEETLEFYDRIKSSDKTVEVYPELYHEILNETGREKVFARITAWLFSKF